MHPTLSLAINTKNILDQFLTFIFIEKISHVKFQPKKNYEKRFYDFLVYAQFIRKKKIFNFLFIFDIVSILNYVKTSFSLCYLPSFFVQITPF